jgi:hypothetical protein
MKTILLTTLSAVIWALPVAASTFNGALGVGSSPITFYPSPTNEVQIGASVINAFNGHDFSDYGSIALEWALSMSSTNNSVTPDLFSLSGGTSGTITMPAGETITFGLTDGQIINGSFSPIHGPGDAINGTVTFTTYQPDGAEGTILNGVVNVTGNADPSGFFSSLGLRSGYPGGPLALSLDVTCTAGSGAVPCIAAMDPSGTVNSAGLTAAPATAAVPEPNALALLGCGVMALGLIRRRRED